LAISLSSVLETQYRVLPVFQATMCSWVPL
jgi:hypothetical protein